MDFTSVEAAVCLRALQSAARWERRLGDPDAGDAFEAVRARLLGRYCLEHPGGAYQRLWLRDPQELVDPGW